MQCVSSRRRGVGKTSQQGGGQRKQGGWAQAEEGEDPVAVQQFPRPGSEVERVGISQAALSSNLV